MVFAMAPLAALLDPAGSIILQVRVRALAVETAVSRAGLAVIAKRLSVLIHLPTAIVIHAVADLDGEVGNQRVQRLAVGRVVLTVSVIVIVAGIAGFVIVCIDLFTVRNQWAVVIRVHDSILVCIRDAVFGAGLRCFAEACTALPVAASERTVSRTHFLVLVEAANFVSAPAAVQRTVLWNFAAFADAVATCRATIRRTRGLILTLVQNAETVPTNAAILRTVIGVFPFLAQSVAARGHAVNETVVRRLAHLAFAVAAGGRAISRTRLVSLVQTAEEISAPSAVHEAPFGALSPDAIPISTPWEAILRTGPPIRAGLVMPADSIAAGAAVNGAVLRTLGIHTNGVTARTKALGLHSTRHTHALRTVFVQCAGVVIFTRFSIVAWFLRALPFEARIHSAWIVIVAVHRQADAGPLLTLVVVGACIAINAGIAS